MTATNTPMTRIPDEALDEIISALEAEAERLVEQIEPPRSAKARRKAVAP